MTRDRYLPDEPFPPYTYVPGTETPHPASDPRGHSYRRLEGPCTAPAPDRPLDCEAYLRGIDLFNHGYYWEAHEAWEQVWHACGRRGPIAVLLKGLIKLAAAGVKAREGNADGVARHARRAGQLFSEAAAGPADERPQILGLDLRELIERSASVAADPVAESGRAGEPLVVFRFRLHIRTKTRPEA